MGFFKNLIKGDFKKIGRNFANNISKGKIVSGTGIDGIINTAASVYTGGALTAAGAVIPDNIGEALIKRKNTRAQTVKPSKQVPQTAVLPPVGTTSYRTTAQPSQTTSTNSGGIDVNGDGKDDTLNMLLLAGAAFLAFKLLKK